MVSAACRHARPLRHDSLASGVYCSAEAWGGFPNATSSPQEITAHKRWFCSWGLRFALRRWPAATTVHPTVDRSQPGTDASLVVGVVSEAVRIEKIRRVQVRFHRTKCINWQSERSPSAASPRQTHPYGFSRRAVSEARLPPPTTSPTSPLPSACPSSHSNCLV